MVYLHEVKGKKNVSNFIMSGETAVTLQGFFERKTRSNLAKHPPQEHFSNVKLTLNMVADAPHEPDVTVLGGKYHF